MKKSILIVSFVFTATAGCDTFVPEKGKLGQPCLANGSCDDWLACLDGVCTPPEDDCAGRECGVSPHQVADCGTCPGATEYCNGDGKCIDDCAGRECGLSPVKGYDCGTCSGAKPYCHADGTCSQDPCYPDPCHGHGTCSGGACTCDPGYAGAACDQCSTFSEYPDCFLPGAGFCDTSQCFIVPPTNQNQCYDNSSQMTCTAFPCNADGTPRFCGQDAQYPDNDRVFTCYDGGGTVQDPCDSSADPDEVVTDSLTGLMWQRTWASGLTWQQAIDYCDSLVYAGHADWRLPNPLELLSIVDEGRYSPAIDTAAFPGTPSDWFWSSSSNAFFADNAWSVSFGVGFVNSSGKSHAYNARCVRPGPSSTGWGGEDRYNIQEPVAGEQVVYDAVTGLLWQKSYESSLTWQQALSYCEGLDYAGHDDWKLPDKKELASLVNYSKYGPASDFPDTPFYRFWSSSSHASNAGDAWYVDFDDGSVGYNVKLNADNARCVRPGP